MTSLQKLIWKKKENTNEQTLTNKGFCSLVGKASKIKGLRGKEKEKRKNGSKRMAKCKNEKE